MFLAWGAAALAQQVVIYTDAETVPPPPIRSGPSVGLSLGLASGIGPTVGIPFGRHVDVQATLLPIVIPDVGAGGSFGLRSRQFLGKNPRSRMYLTEGAGLVGGGDSWLWGFGAGAGVEVRKDATTGLTKWFDVTVTAIGSEELYIVLPLPQLGVAWVF